MTRLQKHCVMLLSSTLVLLAAANIATASADEENAYYCSNIGQEQNCNTDPDEDCRYGQWDVDGCVMKCKKADGQQSTVTVDCGTQIE